ncbi:DUF1059 domain-containing protein [Sulfolobus sp. E5-1-F]|uniref:DUF1059 domain-containing protein n=1 Tax=Sulfolobaceae TaxID=118883 RepID=UPI0012978C43|nr:MULTISPECIES: DUF1059 domain-containing protein [unclassified Sulfolobus]QGA53794.1 DUF1059 domain-containing protein [Sulfolobus sp. E5-1-F]QGA68550.1 DUF1059 domain-containing protein [Sulfolobus sp. E11-6]
MTYSFKCKDVGQKCDFEVKGAMSEDELMAIIKAHAEKAHNIKEVTPEMMSMIQKAIKKE